VDAGEQLYVALQHAARRLRELDEELGLSPIRFAVLARLRYDGPQRIGELARGEGVAQPTITQVVQGMEKLDLVARRPDREDRRGCVVELTSHGRAVVRRARARKIAWVDAALADLDAGQRRILGEAAGKIDRASGRGASRILDRTRPER
jgi:DNA-binding MarR family transcriptional regulator